MHIVLPVVAAAVSMGPEGVWRYHAVDLGRLPGTTVTRAAGIAADGTVVGSCLDAQQNQRGFIARPGAAMEGLPIPAGYTSNEPAGISSDGMYITGVLRKGPGREPVPYSYTGGEYRLLPGVPGYSDSRPAAINSKGEVVGTMLPTAAGARDEYFWSPATGYVDLTPGEYGVATDINDSSRVTGGGPGTQPYVWSPAEGIVVLGYNPPQGDPEYSRGEGISPGGTVVGADYADVPGPDRAAPFVCPPGQLRERVGSGVPFVSVGLAINDRGTAVGAWGMGAGPTREPWVYTPQRGVEPLQPLVDDPWAMLGGQVADINEAGQIAAAGFREGDPYPRAMLLVPVGACYANCDGSTVPPLLNVSDFVCFQALFAAGDPRANCDGSTVPPVLNVADFVCFQTAFAAGCPGAP